MVKRIVLAISQEAGRAVPMWRRRSRACGSCDLIVVSLLCAITATSCSRSSPAAKPSAPGATAAEEATPAYEIALPPKLRPVVDKTFTGDFDQMVKRRLIRIGVPFNRSYYFIDKGVQRGLSYEYAMMFEDQLNKQLNTGNLRVHVVLLPMPRDVLLQWLREGKVDLVVAQLTITPERRKLVDFSIPTRTNVNEVLVTGPGAPVTSLDDLGVGNPQELQLLRQPAG
jgi:ABC-type amino acid transport substrate-binding protein